jgi:hypothetical protein
MTGFDISSVELSGSVARELIYQLARWIKNHVGHCPLC